MRDRDVRTAVLTELDALHAGDANTRVVQEMGIWAGSVRVDVAVINGELHGFELKSARDTLERLPAQAALYNQVFDRVTLVVAERHADKALHIIPDWWGIWLASASDEQPVVLAPGRSNASNPNLQPVQIARLLWRAEALGILDRHGLARGFRSKPVEALTHRLAAELPLDLLRDEVRLALKVRQGWLGDNAPQQCKVPIHANLHPVE